MAGLLSIVPAGLSGYTKELAQKLTKETKHPAVSRLFPSFSSFPFVPKLLWTYLVQGGTQNPDCCALWTHEGDWTRRARDGFCDRASAANFYSKWLDAA